MGDNKSKSTDTIVKASARRSELSGLDFLTEDQRDAIIIDLIQKGEVEDDEGSTVIDCADLMKAGADLATIVDDAIQKGGTAAESWFDDDPFIEAGNAPIAQDIATAVMNKLMKANTRPTPFGSAMGRTMVEMTRVMGGMADDLGHLRRQNAELAAELDEVRKGRSALSGGAGIFGGDLTPFNPDHFEVVEPGAKKVEKGDGMTVDGDAFNTWARKQTTKVMKGDADFDQDYIRELGLAAQDADTIGMIDLDRAEALGFKAEDAA